MILQALDAIGEIAAVVPSAAAGPAFAYVGGMRSKFGTFVDV
jgi:hypothetical protein